MPTVDSPPREADRSPSSLGVHLALFFAQVFLGSLSVEGKIAMSPSHHVSPRALAMVRILGGAAVFSVAHRVLRTPRVSRLRDMGSLALLSIFGIVLNQALFLAGLRQTSPISATLLAATIPVFTAGIAALTGRERLSLRTGAGIAVALFGVAALSGFALPRRGDVLVLFNSMSYALYIVFAKPTLERFGTVTVVAWVFGCGALLFAPVGAVALVEEAPTWPLSTSGLVAFIVFVPTVLGYAANAWALRRAAPSLVVIYIYLQPLIVAVLAYLQLGHALDLRTALSGVVIFAGVGLVASAPRRVAVDPVRAPRPSER
jgi:drug/metabolite transporter (DMT)-like permease